MLLVVVVCRALQLADLILISQSVTWMLELLLNLRLWKDAFSMAKYNVEDKFRIIILICNKLTFTLPGAVTFTFVSWCNII